MAYCSNCGSELPGNTAICPNCGYNIFRGQETREVQPYATGGLVAWSIITLLLCLIPGIVALVQTTGINSCTTPELQAQKIRSAKTWCIVGTVLGVIGLILEVILIVASAAAYPV